MGKVLSEEQKQTTKSTVSRGLRAMEKQPFFAVIDTETNWNDAVMSIGLAIGSTEDFSTIKEEYFIIFPEANLGGMYSNALYYNNGPRINQCKRQEAIQSIKDTLEQYGISTIFAYNAKFDYRHLPELSGFVWLDIMRIAAYRQFNTKLEKDGDFFSTGKLKRDYGVEPMYRLLSNDYDYLEKHNAVFDAVDELKIMNLLGVSIRTYYENACINPNRLQFAITYIENNFLNVNDNPPNNEEKNQKVVTTHSISSEEYDGREIIDAKETAEILDVSVNQVYLLIRTGKIEAYKKKNKYQVLKQSVFEYQELRAHQMRVMLWMLVIFAGLALIWIAIMLSKL